MERKSVNAAMNAVAEMNDRRRKEEEDALKLVPKPDAPKSDAPVTAPNPFISTEQPAPAATSKTVPPELRKHNKTEEEKKRLEQALQSRVGEAMIRGMVRCVAIGPTNNCIANPSMVEQEYVRKMLTSLGSIHLLRHPKHDWVEFKVSEKTQWPLDILCLGLGGGGSLVSFLQRHMTHFKIDVVERDAALLRVARTFLGFREMSTGFSLTVQDPADYVRAIATGQLEKGKGKYDAVFLDCVDEKGRIPGYMTRLEFLSNMKEAMGTRGVACMNVPNHDEAQFTNFIANVRMAFEGRTVLLLHCRTSPNTVLMTFQDNSEKGVQQFGSLARYSDYREIMKAMLTHHAPNIPATLLMEIQPDTFEQVLPGQRYNYQRVNVEEYAKSRMKAAKAEADAYMAKRK